jgi:hypothetical protein
MSIRKGTVCYRAIGFVVVASIGKEAQCEISSAFRLSSFLSPTTSSCHISIAMIAKVNKLQHLGQWELPILVSYATGFLFDLCFRAMVVGDR